MKHFLLISGLLLVCCSNATKNNTAETAGNQNLQFVNELQIQDDKQIDKTEFAPIDTVSLSIFWNKLQNDLRNGNTKEVIEVFEYPIHFEYILLLKFAYDCDTVFYAENSDKYNDFDIDHHNIDQYYDTVFTNYLKDMIYRTGVNDLLEKGYRYKDNTGMTYNFFPQEFYKYARDNCPNDHLLKFHISFENTKWSIEVGGL
jgi:hypothetical protein